jgi:hypothetical protein
MHQIDSKHLPKNFEHHSRQPNSKTQALTRHRARARWFASPPATHATSSKPQIDISRENKLQFNMKCLKSKKSLKLESSTQTP